MAEHCTLIFDIGKTNKKAFLFDEKLSVCWEEFIRFDEIPDDDGFPSEDLPGLMKWIKEKVIQVIQNRKYKLEYINFSTYGASLVYLDKDRKPILPFYNYLKPYPEDLKFQFFEKYGNEQIFSLKTSSPSLGMLNSGLQLYYLKNRKKEVFNKIEVSLHFPQFLSSTWSNHYIADFTSLGCHTGMWDFKKSKYAGWLENEKIIDILTPVVKSTTTKSTMLGGNKVNIGVGVHDSSAALVPYVIAMDDPFVLLSTGTWSICLNPFNQDQLTSQDLQADCLQFLNYEGKPVKASRLFLGKHFDKEIEKLSSVYNVDQQHFKNIDFNRNFKSKRDSNKMLWFDHHDLGPERFGFKQSQDHDLNQFENFEDAYHNFLDELTDLQIASMKLALGNTTVSNIIIDGGFSTNPVFLQMMANKLRDYEVLSVSGSNGSAIGAALLMQFDDTKRDVYNGHLQLNTVAPIDPV